MYSCPYRSSHRRGYLCPHIHIHTHTFTCVRTLHSHTFYTQSYTTYTTHIFVFLYIYTNVHVHPLTRTRNYLSVHTPSRIVVPYTSLYSITPLLHTLFIFTRTYPYIFVSTHVDVHTYTFVFIPIYMLRSHALFRDSTNPSVPKQFVVAYLIQTHKCTLWRKDPESHTDKVKN